MFRDAGLDAVIVYDDLTKHAVAYRQIALLLRRPVGREAYPGDIFYTHSRLLERACCLNEDHGDGSLTAFPICETQEGDVSSYIPTNIISITDGQIYLDTALFFEGVKPAIDLGISVSRVGSAAQPACLKELGSSLRLELANYRELNKFSQFDSNIDAETKKVLKRGRLLIEVLKQDRLCPLHLWQETLILYAALNDYLDDLNHDLLPLYESTLISLPMSEYFSDFHEYLVDLEDDEDFTFEDEDEEEITDEDIELLGMEAFKNADNPIAYIAELFHYDIFDDNIDNLWFFDDLIEESLDVEEKYTKYDQYL